MSNIPVIEAETVETVCWDPASVYLKDNVDKTPSEEEHMQPNVNATVQFNVLHRFYWVFKVFFCFDLEPRGHVTWCWAGSCWRVHDLCSTSQIPSSTLAHIFLNCVTMWLGVYSFMMRVGTCSLERGCLVQGQPLCPKMRPKEDGHESTLELHKLLKAPSSSAVRKMFPLSALFLSNLLLSVRQHTTTERIF